MSDEARLWAAVAKVMAAGKEWVVFKSRPGGVELRRPLDGKRMGKRGGLLKIAYVLSSRSTGLELRGLREGSGFQWLADSGGHTDQQLVDWVLTGPLGPNTVATEDAVHPTWGVCGDVWVSPAACDFPEDDNI